MKPKTRLLQPHQPSRGWLIPKASRQPFGEWALGLAYLSAVLLVVGIMVPSFTMIPKLGDGWFESVVRLFVSDDLTPKTFSILGGVTHLFADGELFIAALLLCFSIIFPAAKLVVTLIAAHQDAHAAKFWLTWLGHLGKWSMLDVFVLAAVVICFKGFPGGSRIQLEWGVYIFALSVVLSMLSTVALKRHLASELE